MWVCAMILLWNTRKSYFLLYYSLFLNLELEHCGLMAYIKKAGVGLGFALDTLIFAPSSLFPYVLRFYYPSDFFLMPA